MLHFLPAPILGIVSLMLITVNTLIWSSLLLLCTIAKLLIPHSRWRLFWSKVLVRIARSWVDGNGLIGRLTQKMQWDVQGLEGLRPDRWYLVISNHCSWADIPILQGIFNRKIPFLKFFLKQELIWVPLLGAAWWALDFPFMKRYSKEALEKRPELRGRDPETTRRACEKFRLMPISVINFLEGTRYSRAKWERQKSSYRHLLLPKAGGIAFALSAMGEYFTEILNVTIVYPMRNVRFWDVLCGRLDRIVVRVERLPIPEEALKSNYETDAEFRKRFQSWINDLWRRKDETIERILMSSSKEEI